MKNVGINVAGVEGVQVQGYQLISVHLSVLLLPQIRTDILEAKKEVSEEKAEEKNQFKRN